MNAIRRLSHEAIGLDADADRPRCSRDATDDGATSQ